MPIPKTTAEAIKHFQDQETPLGRPWRSRDPGVTQVQNAQDVRAIIATELEGERQPTFRQRTATNLPDPVAQLQRAIRAKVGGMDREEYQRRYVHDTEDLTLFLILYGDMDDDKRAGHLNKLSKLTLEKQKEVLKQNNIQLNREEKQVRNQQELARKLQDFKKRSQPVIDAEVRDGDPQ